MEKAKIKISWTDAALNTLVSFIVAGVLYLGFIKIDLFNPFSQAFDDFEYTDLYYSKAMQVRPYAPGKIVLVNFEQRERSETAEIIERVMQQQPKVVALDIMFENRKDSIGDAKLREVLQKYPEIITSYKIDSETESIIGYNPYFGQNIRNAGFINLFGNKNEVIRNYRADIVTSQNDTLHSFASRVADAYLAGTDQKISTSLKHTFHINYRSNINNFIQIDLDRLREPDPIHAMKDVIVLIGYLGKSSASTHENIDRHFTPLDSTLTGRFKQDMYGMVIHANVIDMLIHKRFLSRTEGFLAHFWTVLIALIISIPISYLGMVIQRKYPIHKGIFLKFIQLGITILLVYFILLLVEQGVWLSIKIIIALVLISLSMIDSYYSIKKITHRKWLNFISKSWK